MEAVQSILQKSPPADLETNLEKIRTNVLKDNTDALDSLSKKYLIPLQVCRSDDPGERPFLKCRYNQKDGKHRSPWTNALHPKTDEPEERDDFRLFELSFNEVWDAYKNLYYGHEAVGSVFLRDTSDQKGLGPFSGMFGIYKKKSGCGTWNSVSIVHVDNVGKDDTFDFRSYKVETSVWLVLDDATLQDGEEINTKEQATDSLKVDLSATLSKEVTKELKILPNMLFASHVENIGELIEANEMDLRSQLERVSIPKLVEMMDMLMKEKETSFRPPVNPLMGMIMGSDILKKKLEKQGSN
ncbi:capping protein (actin filament) muscle Z-line, beta [Fistulifera solaris]|uniref:F-actin-capping protein subunit beta n=1 Tax=Fistulifera solaris TaxID=1519565 RepID=A0A1Z5JKR9_FISSO|nr:capping protein (actin filament) muscle Z-line, beta [Fistulifera solaris]|eukprot:GAX14615.1 capping protein (actin filament) muscle Z-line, beta [Fistulifera solaris]